MRVALQIHVARVAQTSRGISCRSCCLVNGLHRCHQTRRKDIGTLVRRASLVTSPDVQGFKCGSSFPSCPGTISGSNRFTAPIRGTHPALSARHFQPSGGCQPPKPPGSPSKMNDMTRCASNWARHYDNRTSIVKGLCPYLLTSSSAEEIRHVATRRVWG